MSVLIKGGRVVTASDDYIADVFVEGERVTVHARVRVVSQGFAKLVDSPVQPPFEVDERIRRPEFRPQFSTRYKFPRRFELHLESERRLSRDQVGGVRSLWRAASSVSRCKVRWCT